MKNCRHRVCNGFLYEEPGTNSDAHAILLESAAWFVWLDAHQSFRFESSTGNFTARKERRAENWYWYAYQRQQGKLVTTYLGKSADLTLAHLEAAALALNSSPAQTDEEDSQTAVVQEAATVQTEQILITKLQVPPLAPHLV